MRTTLAVFLTAAALTAAVHCAISQPALGIVLTNRQPLIDWPASATNYALQSNTNLATTNWVFPTNTVPTNYGSNTAAAVTNLATASFFRLVSLPLTTTDGMALIPAGSFTIGNSSGDLDITDAHPTNVYVSAFYMDTNLVSSNQWQTVYAYATAHGYTFSFSGEAQRSNQPVQYITWYDVVKWSNARSQQAALVPVYYTDAALTQLYTNGGNGTTVYAKWTATGYRLPTEAEWEKAARGGLSGKRFPLGDSLSESQANYQGNTNLSYDLGPSGDNTNFEALGQPYTSPVDYFAPNGYGLHDMAGNVLEWCWDWYAPPTYPAGSPYLGGNDPRGPTSGSERVLRGGGWGFYCSLARCAARDGEYAPFTADNYIGFRCVRGL